MPVRIGLLKDQDNGIILVIGLIQIIGTSN